MTVTVRELLDDAVVTRKVLDRFFDPEAHNWAMFDPELGYRPRTSTVKDGYMGAYSIYNYAPTGERLMIAYADQPCRISTYGNSFTQCHQVSDGETWQEYLAAHLGEPVRNYGVGGYGVYHAYRRMLREERIQPAQYVVLNVWSDDHWRSIYTWRWIHIAAFRNGVPQRDMPAHAASMFHANPWGHLRLNTDSGQFEEHDNPYPTPESMVQLTDADHVYETFRGDFDVQAYAAAQGASDVDSGILQRVADALNMRTDFSTREATARTGKALLKTAALRSSEYVVEGARAFCQREGKKLIVMLSYCSPDVVAACKGEPRFDRSIVRSSTISRPTTISSSIVWPRTSPIMPPTTYRPRPMPRGSTSATITPAATISTLWPSVGRSSIGSIPNHRPTARPDRRSRGWPQRWPERETNKESPMNHRERIQAALAHERPDRCPMQISFTPEFAARLRTHLQQTTGRTHNPHGAGNTYELERALGEDMLLTSVGWANSYYANDVYNPGGETYTDEWDVGWRNQHYQTRFGDGFYTEIAGHPLADASALASYRPPDPTRPALYDEPKRVIAELGQEYWIGGVTVCTIWETAWALRGMERLMMDMVVDPDLADAILDIPFRYHLEAAKRLTALGVDMVWTGDDMGGQQGMVFSPALWRRFFKPRMAQFFSELKVLNPEIVIAYHSDGNFEPIIPDLIEIGLDVLNPIQPACMDPAALKRQYGDRLSFWGSIDEQRTLPFGTPDDVRAEVRQRLATIGQGGGLIIGPTHHVQLDTPVANVLALVEEVRG